MTYHRLLDPEFCRGCRFAQLRPEVVGMDGFGQPLMVHFVTCHRGDCDNWDTSQPAQAPDDPQGS